MNYDTYTCLPKMKCDTHNMGQGDIKKLEKYAI